MSLKADLGLIEGRYGDVVRYAVNHPLFWGYGRGGSITKAPIQQLADLESVSALERERDELTLRLQQLKDEIRDRGGRA